jgi:hypothetical protein
LPDSATHTANATAALRIDLSKISRMELRQHILYHRTRS